MADSNTAFAGCAIGISMAVFLYGPIASSSVTSAMPLRLAGSALGSGHTAIRGLRVRTRHLAAKSAHGVAGVATFILLAGIGDQRLWTLHFDLEGGDQRVFRVNDNSAPFSPEF